MTPENGRSNFFYCKNFKFTIKFLSTKDVSKKYIIALKKVKFLDTLPKNITFKYQINYINSISNKKNEAILGIFNNKKLVFTSHFTNLDKTSSYLGIFLFNKKFLGKGFSKFFIWQVCLFINLKYNIYCFKAGVNNLNFKSKKSFLKSGFRIYKKKKNSTIYILNLKKINRSAFNEQWY